MNLSKALHVASQTVDYLRPSCSEIQTAGSVRRLEPQVKDVEIVYVPKTDTRVINLFGETKEFSLADLTIADLIDQNILARDNQTKRWGPKYKRAIHVPSGMVIELFAATPDNWGYILALRTGPSDYNRIWVSHDYHGGTLPPSLQLEGGNLWRNGQQLSAPTEEIFFATIGIPHWPPPERSAERLREHIEQKRRRDQCTK